MAAVETRPPASFTMLPMDEYQLLLASMCPFLFVHLGSIIPYVPDQFDFYFDYDFSKLFMFPTCLAGVKKKMLQMFFGIRHAPY